MATGTKVSLEEYLETVYRPDCDYVDGEVVERNLGEIEHGDFQLGIGAYLRSLQGDLGIFVGTEIWVRVSPSRFRIPDICVVKGGKPGGRYITEPPFLCIEILSDRDTLDNIQDRLDDYFAMGVPYVWVVNPRTRRAWIYKPDSITEAKDGVLRTRDPEIAVPLREVVAE
jgi:Uma2 family endonuclease